MTQTELSSQIIDQRVRNRLIEWLEMLVEYEDNPPHFDLNEVINQWDDWNHPNSSYPFPTYTSSEADKISLVAIALDDFCSVTSKIISIGDEKLFNLEWCKLVSVSRDALLEMQRRGKLSEEFAAL